MAEPDRGYFASDFSNEAQRQAAMEASYDGDTQRRLAQRGLATGWRCAEIGAGSGSIARWMATQVGPSGHVVALDIDTSRLGYLEPWPNVEVRQQDILAQPIEDDSYDLIHSRLVIEHLPDAPQLLEMLARGLRPGGWLVVECMDVEGVQSADPSHPVSATFDKVVNANLAIVSEISTWDFGFSRAMPRRFYRLGLVNTGHEVGSTLAHGGDLKSVEYALAVRPTANVLVERGAASAAEVDAYFEALEDPDFWFMAPSIIAAWGQARPGT